MKDNLLADLYEDEDLADLYDHEDELADLYEGNDGLEELYEPEAQESTQPQKPTNRKNIPANAFISAIPGATKNIYQGIEKGLQATSQGLEEFNTGATSGMSFGASENAPGYEKKDTLPYKAGEFVGSVLPMSTLIKGFSAPLVYLAKKSPVMKRSLSALAHLIGVVPAGATHKGLEDVFKGKMPTPHELLKNGLQWAELDALLQSAGLGGRFAFKLAKEIRKNKLTPITALEDIYEAVFKSGQNPTPQAALDAIDNVAKAKAPGTGLRQVFNENISKLDDKARINSETILPEKLTLPEILGDNRHDIAQERIENFHERAPTDLELGENVKNDVETAFEEAEKSYNPLYKEVDAGAENIMHSPKGPEGPIQLAKTLLKKLNKGKTKPTGYQTVINTLQTALEDMGHITLPTPEVITSTGKLLKNTPEFLHDVPISQLIELAKRLNKIARYDIVGTSIKDLIKPLTTSIKKEVKRVLPKELAEKYILAEQNFGKTADKFGKDSITKIRGTEAPEQIAKQIESPSALRDIKEVVTPKQFKAIEREILEKIQEASPEKAAKMLREYSPHLSDEARHLANISVAAKQPISPVAKSTTDEVKDLILRDMDNATTTGTRPKKTLDLWRTPRGQRIIKEALKDIPEGKDIQRYLRNQNLADFVFTFVEPSGKIDKKKLSTLMKDPTVKDMLEQIGGPDTVHFFNHLDDITKKFDQGKKIIDKLKETGAKIKKPQPEAGEKVPEQKYERGEELIKRTGEKNKEKITSHKKNQHPFITRLEQIEEKAGKTGKYALGLLGVTGFGIGKSVGLYYAYELFKIMATSKPLRNAIREAASKRSNPTLFLDALDKITKQADSHDRLDKKHD